MNILESKHTVLLLAKIYFKYFAFTALHYKSSCRIVLLQRLIMNETKHLLFLPV